MVEILMLIVAIFVAIITFFTWRISQRVAWLTGAMETHSSIMLMIEAKSGLMDNKLKMCGGIQLLKKQVVKKSTIKK